jgi:hypothetical protein
MGAVGFVGFVLLAAFVVGLLAGAVFIGWRKLKARLKGEDEFPLVDASPLTQGPHPAPPSTSAGAPR